MHWARPRRRFVIPIALVMCAMTATVASAQFGRGGFFHSGSMHMIEKLTRTGNELKYEVTIEDPEVLAEPWVMKPRILRTTPGQVGIRQERANCEVYEEGNVENQLRH